MNPMVVAKLALAGAGIVVWGMGVRLGNAMLRWTGVGLLVAAFLLRFARGSQDN